jgi:hypothetical protein
MTVPGFTAEASLRRQKQSYVLESDNLAGTGKVLP